MAEENYRKYLAIYEVLKNKAEQGFKPRYEFSAQNDEKARVQAKENLERLKGINPKGTVTLEKLFEVREVPLD